MTTIVAAACGCAHADAGHIQPGTPATAPRASPGVLVRLLDLESLLPVACRSAAADGGGEVQAARQAVLSRVVDAELQTEAARAMLDREQNVVAEAEHRLRDEHNRRVGALNVTAGLFAAGTAFGTAMTLRSSTNTAGIWIGTISGAAAAVLSIAALDLPDPRAPAGSATPSSLAPFADPRRGPAPYPDLIWRCLRTSWPRRASPIEELRQQWLLLGRGESLALAASPVTADPVPAETLRQWLLMIADLRTTVDSIDTALAELWGEVSTGECRPGILGGLRSGASTATPSAPPWESRAGGFRGRLGGSTGALPL